MYTCKSEILNFISRSLHIHNPSICIMEIKNLQPFEEFKPGYISRLLQMGRRYLVSQSYWRASAQDPVTFNVRISLLFSDYVEAGEARLHFNAVKKDRYAAIIDLQKPAHLNKIREMLQEGSGYRIFFAVVRSAKDLENQINRQYREKLKQYVEKQTNWRISRDAIVKPAIQLSFGELFIILKHGNQHIRIKFDEIEKA